MVMDIVGQSLRRDPSCKSPTVCKSIDFVLYDNE
jgi:hypothetical protein